MTGPKNEESKMGCSEDAENLYQATKDADPFPHIPSALLNSADIHDYIEATGMLYPYDPKFMKSSSYEAQIGERAIYWNEKEEKKTVPLTETSTVKLAPNSLVFFETKQEFRLPPYMAIRFNLRITNVHKGLLLGTGPLVDPGFCGKLLIPIHNLTNNTYTFIGDEKFIWIEFTKVSPHADWDKSTARIIAQSGIYIPFPENKKWRTPNQYFVNAYNGDPIRNAVPAVLEEVRGRAKTAEKSASDAETKIDRRTIWGGLGLVITLVIAAVTAVVAFYPLITNSVNLSKDVANVISDFGEKYQGHLEQEQSFDSRINTLEKNISDLKDTIQVVGATAGQKVQIDQFRKEIDALKIELKNLKTVASEGEPSPKEAN